MGGELGARMRTAWAVFIRSMTERPSVADVQWVMAMTPFGAAVSAINVIAFMAIALRSEPVAPLLLWAGGSLALFAGLSMRTRRAAARGVTRVSRRAGPRMALFALAFALPWVILVATHVGQGPLPLQMAVGLLSAGMTAGGAFLLHRAMISAVVYVAAILLALSATALLRDAADMWSLALLSAPYSLCLYLMALNAARTSRQMEISVEELSGNLRALNAANDEIRLLAYTDAVTGLPNRKAFHDHLGALTDRAGRSGARIAVLLMDLDRFKNVNDSYGHPAGDRLLSVVGARIAECLRGEDMVARLGGDEFAVVIERLDDAETASVGQRIIDRLAAPVRLGEAVIHTGASIGMAQFPDDARSSEGLLLRADIALNRAKDAGRGLLMAYRPAMEDAISEDNRVEAALRGAILQQELQIHYQPKCCIRTGRLMGAEALLRWRHADMGWIGPDKMLEVAEGRGLLTRITDFVFAQVTRDILIWRLRGLSTGPVAVNIHPVDLKNPQFLLGLLRRTLDAGVGNEDMVIEITEGCVVGRGSDAASLTLDAINDMGFEMSLDDFGTGHASLSHLKRLPVRELKIDREFVTGLCVNRSDRAIVSAALEIARCMDIRCVAEGVQDAGQVAALQELGAELGQGYYWSRPLTADDFAEFAAADAALGAHGCGGRPRTAIAAAGRAPHAT